jgi:two-component system, OmpR family, response regulator QseB
MVATETAAGPVPGGRQILLVEDDPQLGPLIVDLLAPEFHVELAVDGSIGLRRALSGTWDALVIDRGLPRLDGLDLIRALRRDGLSLPILVLTALSGVGDTIEGLDAGANDYLAKPFDAAELAARLRALTRMYGERPRTVDLGAWVLDTTTRTMVSDYGHRVTLSPREAQLLVVLAASPDQVFSRQELAATVFGTPVTPGAVDTYVHYLRRKLGRDIIHTVHGSGYQLGNPT